MRDTLAEFQWASWQGAIYDPVGQGFNLFTRSVYSKGGWVLHTLRGVLGDSVFFRSLRAYRQRYAGKSAITTELKAIVDSVSGTDMSWFFNQWIFGPGWPKYASRHSWTQDTLTLTIYQMQSALWPTYKMPIRFWIYGQQTIYAIAMDTARIQSFKVPLSSAPDSVVLDPDGWILKQIVFPPNSVGEDGRPLTFQLFQNYPNPFNPTTNIGFRISDYGFVSLKVYDVLGQEINTLVNEAKPAGEYTVSFDASNLASGLYFYKLTLTESNGTMLSSVKAMLFLR
jgi:hypothetical protein